ncbi:hydrogenase nickel incorporation protein HypB [Candidatus Haliotispira prima]|uniref:Hydrogenase nickel incorporation protein HypB n=1 Tax=Candidatus Haliotispira prima TaxID=3034016 RepID=A0ABY8MI51_9SPIO|nr:hydrogenase nickel incorporation protein HypB [Candidatus Haliotispira prima]
MCSVCGCGEGEVVIEEHDHHHHSEHHHHGHHDHHHIDLGTGESGLHVPGMSQARLIEVEQDIMGKNQAYADANRQLFHANSQLALNLVSSPGSGKTTLLCKVLEELKRQQPSLPLGVIEGDQQTANDARRIRDTGVPAIQINTGKGCHLDGHMVGHALENLGLEENGALFIENVGNLVCPAAFDLGEDFRIAILSVTEGEDKPVKYPNIFASAHVVLINKMDLLPYLDFDLESCKKYIASVAPSAKIFLLSAKTGEGLTEWLSWILEQLDIKSVSAKVLLEKK